MLCCTFESMVFAQSIQIVDNGWCDEGVGEQGEGEGEGEQTLLKNDGRVSSFMAHCTFSISDLLDTG